MKRCNTLFDCILPALAILLCCALAGCGRSEKGHASSSTWGAADAGGVPGIDSGTLSIARRTLNGDEFRFAVWSDLPGGSGLRGRSVPEGWIVEGTVGCLGGQEDLPFACTVNDDMTATMEIGGIEYSVANDTLFLLATGSEKPEVRQLEFDLEDLPADSASKPEFAESNPEIGEFFRSAAARSEPAVIVEPTLEQIPYEVLISVSFRGDASIDTEFRERVISTVPTLLRSRLGQMWNTTIRDDPFVTPAVPVILKRMNAEDLNAAFVPSEFDKVILIIVGRRGSAYEVAGREWDRNSQTAGPAVVREAFDRRRVNEAVAGVASEVFRPLAMIHQVGEEEVELGIRAGEFLAADDDAAQFRPGDYLIAYFRYLDRDRNVRQIQFVPWTFLEVDSVERARMLCHVVSTFRRSPLAGSRRRVELMGIAARPLLPETELTLVPRVDPLNPLVGHRVDVMNRLPTVDDPVEDRVRLLTDRGGTITVPADPESPLRHALVHSGGAVLASVPFMPGLERQALLELPDDTPRLDVEGEIQMMEDELIDIVASRSVIMTRARSAARSQRWDDVDRFLEELDQLTTFEEFDRRLSTLRVAAEQNARRLGDRIAESRIARLCREFREVAEPRLAPHIIEDFHREMDELRTAG